MKLLSVNISLPVEIDHRGTKITTGIYKKPIEGAVFASRLNLEGDRQADARHHGGEHKAVYAYSFKHYSYWQSILQSKELVYGAFGENFTIDDLDEEHICIGDQLQIGDALFAVTQPRVPCFKLGIRFQNEEMPRLFTESALTGCYLKVMNEGTVEKGNSVQLIPQGEGSVTIMELFQAYYHPKHPSPGTVLRRALEVPDLSPEWRERIEQRLSAERKQG